MAVVLFFFCCNWFHFRNNYRIAAVIKSYKSKMGFIDKALFFGNCSYFTCPCSNKNFHRCTKRAGYFRLNGNNVTNFCRIQDKNFEFLVALKNILPQLNNRSLPIVLPITDDERMGSIIKYMQLNVGEPLSLKSLSIRFNMSERSMSRMFQSHIHISFLQYLKTLRMVKAIEMILKTKKSISDIAFHVGYDTIGSFSNTFYAFTQSRPSDFRKT